MEKDELFYTLLLQSINGIGPVKSKKLLEHFGGAKKIFLANRNELKRLKGTGNRILDQMNKIENYQKVEREIQFMDANGISAVTFGQESYPSKLKHCIDAPLVLFSKGTFDINRKKVISIVGTRLMTPYGRKFLKDFIREVKRFDPIIISGLALGTDICAHHESLKNGICTVGVLAHGLDRVYPKQHSGIAQNMLRQGGLYSEFWSGTAPERENFVKRNRIIAGLSEATIVVESAAKGGSLITSELALSYHREVFAVPGKTIDKFSKGCNMLIKSNKAAMITSVNDLEYVLGWTAQPMKKCILQAELFTALNEDERKIYGFLTGSGKILLDQLAAETGYTVQKALMILLQLELKGLVLSHPGKFYQAV